MILTLLAYQLTRTNIKLNFHTSVTNQCTYWWCSLLPQFTQVLDGGGGPEKGHKTGSKYTFKGAIYSESTVVFFLQKPRANKKLVKITRRSCPKRPEPWRPKRRRGGIDTASRATNFDTQQKLRLLLNASSVYWTPVISLNRILGSTRPLSWPNEGGCHGSSFLVIC